MFTAKLYLVFLLRYIHLLLTFVFKYILTLKQKKNNFENFSITLDVECAIKDQKLRCPEIHDMRRNQKLPHCQSNLQASYEN